MLGELVKLLGSNAESLGAVLADVGDDDVVHVGDQIADVVFDALGGFVDAILPGWARAG